MIYNLESKKLELRVNWKLSRNEALFKENFFIKIEDSGFIGVGEIAPNIRYKEDQNLIYENFERALKLNLSLEDLQNHNYGFCHSFAFGLEAALVSLEAQKRSQSISKFLKLDTPLKNIETSYSVPIMDLDKIKEYVSKLSRFRFIKIKVNKDNAVEFVKTIAKYSKVPLRIDGNEAWDNLEDYLDFESKVEGLNIQFIEQPFKSSMVEEYIKLKPISKFEIMGDESIESDVDMEILSRQFHSVNVKLMKSSGFYNAIRLLKEAKKYNLKTMIGCMIESSLGISHAMQLSSLADYFDLDGSLLLKNDPYNNISEKDGLLNFSKN